MSKHTPGPWVVEEWDVREPDGCVINGGLQVVAIKNGAKCSIYAATEDGDGDEMEANLNLIAAAPELLDALMQMVAIHDEPSGFDGKFGKALDEAIAAQRDKIDERLSIARAAIAKAKGV